MFAPSFRYALKTSVGAWATLAVAALEVVVFVTRGQPWQGDLVWAVDWTGTGFVLFGPIIAGAAAIDAGRLGRQETGYLVDATQSPVKPFMVPWLAIVVPVTVVHVLTLAVVVTMAVAPGATTPTWSVLYAILVQLLGVAFYAALGSAIGRRFGSIAGGMIAAVAGFILFYRFGTGSTYLAPLQFGRATTTLLGYKMDIGYLLLQTAILLPAIGILLSVRTRAVKTGRRYTLPAIGMLIFIVAGMAVAASSVRVQRFEPMPITASYCTNEKPRICLFPEHQRFLPSLQEQLSRMYSASQELGVADQLPTEFVEKPLTEGPATDGRGRLTIPPDQFRSGQMDPIMTVQQMVLPDHCTNLYGPKPPPTAFGYQLASVSNTILAKSGYKLIAMSNAPLLSPQDLRKTLARFRTCQLSPL